MEAGDTKNRDQGYAASGGMDGNINPSRLGTYMEPRFLWWQALARVAESQFIRGFNIFLITVPFVVTLLEAIPDVVPLRLPLAWFFGYASGVFFFIAMILVGLWCPDINKPRRTFREIEAEGRTMQYLVQEMREVYMALSRATPSRANHFLRGILGSSDYVQNADVLRSRIPKSADETPINRQIVWQIVDEARFKQDAKQEVFWNIHWYAGNTDPTRRRICFGLFVAGATCALVLLVLQCWRVLSSVFGWA